MQKLLGIFFLLLVSLTGTLAQSSLSTALAELPTCALTCLVSAVESSPCSPTNQTCICTNAQLQVAVTTCVTASCTIKEALTTKNITETICDAPVRDKRAQYNAISNTMGTISGIIVGLRLLSKFMSNFYFGMDDYFIVATLCTGIPATAMNAHGLTPNGLGKDIWTIPFKQITDFLHFFYAMEVLYFAQVALLKLSLLFFYLRIFPANTIKRVIWVTIAFDVLFGIAFVLAGIFQCQPISYYWNQWDGEHKGKCFNVNALAWANAAISITLDLWMLGIPMSQLVHIKLHWKKKIGVALMFIVGTFVTVISVVRLQSLVHFANSINPTWDNYDPSVWSTIEINIGIICACMPSLRVLLVRLFPKILGSTQQPTDKYYANNRSRGVVIASADRSNESSIPPPVPPKKDGIIYSQSYSVQHGSGWESDETSLVQMGDLESSKPRRDQSR